MILFLILNKAIQEALILTMNPSLLAIETPSLPHLQNVYYLVVEFGPSSLLLLAVAKYFHQMGEFGCYSQLSELKVCCRLVFELP
jgi:hypothetical protein